MTSRRSCNVMPTLFRASLTPAFSPATVTSTSSSRNPATVVHMQNGKYQIHMKTINASQVADRNQLAFNVYSELLEALNIIDKMD